MKSLKLQSNIISRRYNKRLVKPCVKGEICSVGDLDAIVKNLPEFSNFCGICPFCEPRISPLCRLP